MRPLRILHTESSLGWGGQEIRVLTEARGVARRGHAVALAAPAQSRILAEASAHGIEAIELSIARKRLPALAAMRRLLSRRAFDVVNTHSSTDSWLAALACASLAAAPRLVRTRHISAPVSPNAATRWLYGTATARVVTTGERLREQVIAEAAIDATRVVSIPTGIDLSRFTPGDRGAARAVTGLPVDSPVIGIVATLRDWKGHVDLLQAMARFVGMRDVVLAIVGDGPQRAALEKLTDELGLRGRVRFAGDQRDVVPWLRSFDLFCLPSYANEGVPQALMQAMACALPVVTTPVGSIGEIVEDGLTGVLVPPRDVGRLQGALERLLADGTARAALGARAMARAQANFSEERMIDRMLAVFADVAGAA